MNRYKQMLEYVFSNIYPEIITPRVIYYHNIHDEIPEAVSINNFRSQIDFLISQGYCFLSLRDAAIRIENGNLSQRTIILTFDDGYLDNYTHALQILTEKNVCATFFVVSSAIGFKQASFDNGRTMLPMMSKDHLLEMSKAGMEIASHTHTHAHMKRLIQFSYEKARYELMKSKEILENIIEREVVSFAYPNGQKGVFSDNTKRLLIDCGYKFAATTIWGGLKNDCDPYCIPRCQIRAGDNINIFKRKIYGNYDFMRYYSLLVDRSKYWKGAPSKNSYI